MVKDLVIVVVKVKVKIDMVFECVKWEGCLDVDYGYIGDDELFLMVVYNNGEMIFILFFNMIVLF